MMCRRLEVEVLVRRRQVAALGVVLTLAIGACATDREVTRPEPEPVTEERLAEALLTEDDLPGAFTAVAEPQTTITSELIPEHACDDRLGSLEPEESATSEFTGNGTTLTGTVAWFPGGGAAVEQLLRDISADCSAVVVSDEGLSIRTGPLRFGVLSDDTLPISVEVEPSSGAIEERDLILVRRGDLVYLIRLVGLRPSDKGLLDSVARLAIGRIALAHDETT